MCWEVYSGPSQGSVYSELQSSASRGSVTPILWVDIELNLSSLPIKHIHYRRATSFADVSSSLHLVPLSMQTSHLSYLSFLTNRPQQAHREKWAGTGSIPKLFWISDVLIFFSRISNPKKIQTQISYKLTSLSDMLVWVDTADSLWFDLYDRFVYSFTLLHH